MSRLPALLVSPPPSVGVEIVSNRVTAVWLGKQAGGWIVSAYGTERLAPRGVTPALNAVNGHDRRALTAPLRAAFGQGGARPRPAAVVIPGRAAKISLLRFDKIPAAADLDQLIRWQVRKAAPFKPEDAQISWVPAAPIPGGGREYLVTLARRDIVESYMLACAGAGAEAGAVDLASLNLIKATVASGGGAASGDWLIGHVAPDYATLTIVRDGNLILFRSRQLLAEGDLADVVHQTAMYHEDRLGGAKFARVVLSGAALRGAETGE